MEATAVKVVGPQDGTSGFLGSIGVRFMLAVTGGRERTATELNELFDRAELSGGPVLETAGPLRIVEAATV